MNARTIELLAASFARVCANKSDAATIFYARLFMTAPELRPLFQTDIESQKRKLMSSLAQIVDFYRVGVDPTSYLAELGRSHQGYGAQRSHFDSVGDALLFTLAQVLGQEFSPEIRAAWVSAYAEVSAAMIRAGDIEAAPAPHPLAETARL
ncbi:MAG TPA: globin domain-containing protein [Polyangiaceae bacterium]|nr:globin domain-containing protein [Polyangiaceae bacterium]